MIFKLSFKSQKDKISLQFLSHISSQSAAIIFASLKKKIAVDRFLELVHWWLTFVGKALKHNFKTIHLFEHVNKYTLSIHYT